MEKRPRLQQALHGYSDGHRQLALSTTLKLNDQKRLLALSDISGPGADLSPEGYLTGYPLTESGLFALGRTWPAPEMSRPGCVWTHTLLIDFSDLAALKTLTGVLGMFRRPIGASAAPEYAKPVLFISSPQTRLSSLAQNWARQVMRGLYGEPRSRIVVTRFGDEVDRTVLALWSQQWPRLRRRFRFCTLATRDRSVDRRTFDLQVLPTSDRSARTRFLDVVDAGLITSSSPLWLDDALKDLLHPEDSDLRDLFRRLGADVAVGREAFRPFCRLHRALTTSLTQPGAVSDAIAIVQGEFGEHQPQTAQAIVAEAAVKRLEALDERSFAFLWENRRLLHSDTLEAGAARLGRSAWRRDPRLLIPLLGGEGTCRALFDRTVADLDAAELVAGLPQAPALLNAALFRRPDLVTQPTFWEKLDSVDEALRLAKDAHMHSAVSALMSARRDDLALRAVQEFGSGVILHVLGAAWDAVSDRANVWLHASARDPAAVAGFLLAESSIPRSMMYALALVLSPEAVPDDYGDDPWLIAIRRGVGQIDVAAASYLAAYLLSRALNRRSRCAAELAQLSFESTHAALASNRLLYKAWRLLEMRLPWSSTWFEWDRCHRLRAGVVSLFIDRGLAPGLFARLCEDDDLFCLLAQRAARNKRGRSYLKRVRRFMESVSDERLVPRLGIIDGLL